MIGCGSLSPWPAMGLGADLWLSTSPPAWLLPTAFPNARGRLGNLALANRPIRDPADQPLGRAASMALTNSASSGVVRGENRLISLPSGPIRNFSKFQLILPLPTGLVSCAVRN